MKIKRTLASFVLVDSNMRIIPEVLDFTNTLLQRGLSINTVASYLRDLRIFYEWLESVGINFYEVKPRDLKNFVLFIDNRHVAGRAGSSTINRYLATLSSFYRHHESLGGWVTENPVVKVNGNVSSEANNGYLRHTVKSIKAGLVHYFKRKKKKSSIDRKRLFEDQALTFYDVVGDHWSHNEDLKMRNQLVFKILYETGMRIGELLHLQVEDFDYPDPTRKTGNIYLISREESDGDRQLKTGERTIPVTTDLLTMNGLHVRKKGEGLSVLDFGGSYLMLEDNGVASLSGEPDSHSF
ncbi:hypothetical protein AN963_10080 [Brevibacillus choshinensis]|uniref:Integrase n=1 Tax=Brevibacillus choshinensis TaxID=54911 RepID=A0ABR5NEL6_BRECH|nr:site-specific integrase [Brevibacillus choshinensis]KQL49999.1 hypothetical protein AN963_10080 [Brevibacillus choshinensis]